MTDNRTLDTAVGGRAGIRFDAGGIDLDVQGPWGDQPEPPTAHLRLTRTEAQQLAAMLNINADWSRMAGGHE